MTLLARRREELARAASPHQPAEKTRSVAARQHQPRPSFLHLQAALGNRATSDLLLASAATSERHGEPLGGDAALSLGRLHGAAAHPQLDVALRLLQPARPPLLVADGSAAGRGQMSRSAFLVAMREAARAAAEEAFRGTDHTARGCPWIEHYFRFYQQQSAERIEADLRRYMPAARAAVDVRDLVVFAAEHVRASVRHWAETGELRGVPRGLPGNGLLRAIAGSSAAEIQAQLGAGRPLETSARSRMERVFGTRFDAVRLHTDAIAARLAQRAGARAFAVGPHVAFDRGEYRPGTPVGDALLAHELAHTVQQRGTETPAARHSATPVRRMEGEADAAAAGALAQLWCGARNLAGALAQPAMPRLQSGLTLARCCRDDFTDKELQEYLDQIKAKGKAGGCEGDNKARAVVNKPGKFKLDDIHVHRMIEDMIDGPTGGDDEDAILELLETSKEDRLNFLFTKGTITAKWLLEDFSDPQETQLRSFFERRFEGGLKALQATPPDVYALPDATDAAEIKKVKDSLIATFKFSGVADEKGARWRRAELEEVAKGLAKLPKPYHAAIANITLKRVKKTTCDFEPPACFQRQIDKDTGERRDAMELGDDAFKGAAVDLGPVEEVVLHEAGHGVETAEKAVAESKRLKQQNVVLSGKNDERSKAITAFNAAVPPADAVRYEKWKIVEEKNYGEALIAVNAKFTAISKVINEIPTHDPPAKVLTEAATKIETLADEAETKIPDIDKARDALLKKKPKTDRLRPEGEKSFKDRLKAARAVVKTTRDQAKEQKQFDADKAAEAAVSAKIPLVDKGKVIDASRRLAELVALVELKGIDVKGIEDLSPYVKKRWPQKPGELFAELFQLSITAPAKLEKLDADVAAYFREPLGPKGKLKKQVDAKVASMNATSKEIEEARGR